MSVASGRGTSGRGTNRSRSPSTGSSGSSGAKSSGKGQQSDSKQQKSATRSARQPRAQSQKGKSAQKSATQKRGQAQSQSEGQSGTESKKSSGSGGAISNIVIPLATATIGVAGGVLLGRNARQRTKKVLGIPIPINVDFGDVTTQIGQAGKQLGKLASEVQAVREKAEQIGRAVG